MKQHAVQTRCLGVLPGLLPVLWLAACAQLPATIRDLNWKDRWGDRGEQVLSRDYAMCQQLVEQRRSLLATCMSARGWSWEDGP